eukprot:7475972-Lingulodinium_polyedra.AAC.1
MAAPAATSNPSARRKPPPNAMIVGVSVPKHPRWPEAPRGTVTSAPRGRARRGIKARRRLTRSAHR